VADKPVDAWNTPFGQGVLRIAALFDDRRNVVRQAAGQSARFLSLLLASGNKFIFNKPPGGGWYWVNPKDFRDKKDAIDEDGWILTPSGQRTGRRLINFYASPVEKLFEPHPSTSTVLDAGDAITLNAWELAAEPPRVKEYVAIAAHEMQHALNYFASASAHKDSKPDFATRIQAFLKDEAGARVTEKIVRKEIGDPSATRTLADARTITEQIELIQAGVELADIARSFPSGLYLKTYAETFVIRQLQKQLVKMRPQTVSWHYIWKDVDALLDRPLGAKSPISNPDETPPSGSPAIEKLAEPLRSLDGYADLLALFAVFGGAIADNEYLDLALIYMIERILDHRWRALDRVHRNDPKYFELLEEMTIAHAALLLEPIKGATHEMMYGKAIPHVLKASK
jgi:hypothetical protein